MPIHTPGRRAGSGAALRSAKKAMSGKSGKSLFASLNLTSMVDFMTVVVIFLLMQFSASGEILFMQKDIRLPDAASGGELERVPVVAISADSITMEGAIVTSLSQLPEGEVIPELQSKLDQARNSWTATNPGKPFDHKIIVQADQDVAFKYIRRVMVTCTVGQYNNLMFATRRVGPAAPAAAAE
jgi:biopolymer transport protein ExbD